MQSAYNLVQYVGELKPGLRMCRLGSNQLPMYTQPTWRYYWQKPDIRKQLARGYAKVGKLARELGVRLSFHPGQFTVLASDNPDIVERSIEEFEYHVDMVQMDGLRPQLPRLQVSTSIYPVDKVLPVSKQSSQDYLRRREIHYNRKRRKQVGD